MKNFQAQILQHKYCRQIFDLNFKNILEIFLGMLWLWKGKERINKREEKKWLNIKIKLRSIAQLNFNCNVKRKSDLKCVWLKPCLHK